MNALGWAFAYLVLVPIGAAAFGLAAGAAFGWLSRRASRRLELERARAAELASAENLERALRVAGLEILRGRYLELGLEPPAWLEDAIERGQGVPLEPRRVRVVAIDANGRRRRVVIPPGEAGA